MLFFGRDGLLVPKKLADILEFCYELFSPSGFVLVSSLTHALPRGL